MTKKNTTSPRLLLHSDPREGGVYFVLSAVFIVAVILILLAMVGFSLYTYDRIKHQNVSNLAALAALGGYMNDNTLTPGQRRQKAIDRANQVMQRDLNDYLGKEDKDAKHPGISMGGGEGGELTLGHWDHQNPKCQGVPDTPGMCFTAGGSADDINAMHLEANTPPSNAILTPFGKFMGMGGLDIETEAYAGVRPRCLMFGLDVSPSIAGANFRMLDVRLPYEADTLIGQSDDNMVCYRGRASGKFTGVCSVRRAYPVFLHSRLAYPKYPDDLWNLRFLSKEKIDKLELDPDGDGRANYNLDTNGDGVNDDFDIDDDDEPDYPRLSNGLPDCNNGRYLRDDKDYPYAAPHDDQFVWCAHLKEKRPHEEVRTVGGDYSLVHYRSDYEPDWGPDGLVWVNRYANPDPEANYFGPEPWYSVMSAMNGALRVMKDHSTNADFAGLVAFSGRVRDIVPLSQNYDPLIMATNPNNRGLNDAGGNEFHPVIEPNFIKRGWYPILSTKDDPSMTSFTNLNAAVVAITNELSKEGVCPRNALRIGVLATDGLMNCTNPDGGVSCGDKYDHFKAAHDEFRNIIQTQTSGADIKWIVLHTGYQYLDLHIINKISPEWTVWQDLGGGYDTQPTKFLTFEKAGQLGGASGYTAGGAYNVVEFDHAPRQSKESTGRNIFDNIWTSKERFNGANGYLFELARGGTYCPLTDTWNLNFAPAQSSNMDGTPAEVCPADGLIETYYKPQDEEGLSYCKLRDDLRTPNSKEDKPIYHMPQQDQAARCLLKWLAKLPYMLLPEEGMP